MKKETVTTNQITEGVIWKQLLLFFFPIVLGTFFQQLYNTADTIVVGRFVSKEALAAVGGSAAQIVGLIVGFFVGLAFGYYFPVLWCEGQSAAEPCPAYCLCILYHWKYFHHRSGNSDRSLDA